jgi:hypothetical protein
MEMKVRAYVTGGRRMDDGGSLHVRQMLADLNALISKAQRLDPSGVNPRWRHIAERARILRDEVGPPPPPPPSRAERKRAEAERRALARQKPARTDASPVRSGKRKPKKRKRPGGGSVWTISGGLPGLGKRS